MMKFTKYTEQMMLEVLDKPQPIKWKDTTGFFTVNSNDYAIHVHVEHRRHESGAQAEIADISFKYKDENGRWQYSLKKGGDQSEANAVLATVLKGTFDYVEQNKPNIVTYSSFSDADSKDASKRLRLYTTLTKKYAAKHGYTWGLVGDQFTLTSQEFLDHVTQILDVVPKGLQNFMGKQALVSLSVANAAAFVHAFQATNSKVSGKLGHGRIAIDINSRYGARARALINYEQLVLTDPATWDILLPRAVWIDKTTAEEHTDHDTRVGIFNDWYVVYTPSAKLVDIYYDPDEFWSWAAPAQHDLNREKMKI